MKRNRVVRVGYSYIHIPGHCTPQSLSALMGPAASPLETLTMFPERQNDTSHPVCRATITQNEKNSHPPISAWWAYKIKSLTKLLYGWFKAWQSPLPSTILFNSNEDAVEPTYTLKSLCVLIWNSSLWLILARTGKESWHRGSACKSRSTWLGLIVR